MDTDLPIHRKDKDSWLLIEKALRSSVYLQQIIRERRVLKAIINAMELKKVSAKTLVTEAGKLGEEMYVCAEGDLEMFDGYDGQFMRKIERGHVFGEMAFICFTKRKTTVRARIPCKLWVLHQSHYIKILRLYYAFEDRDYIAFLRTFPVLQKLSDETLMNIVSIGRVECYAPNFDIIRQGDEGNDLFILTGGTALVHVTNEAGERKILGRLEKGDFFGEGAILGNGIRNATVMSEPPGVECILFRKEDLFQFVEDFKPIQEAANKRQEMMMEIFEKDIEYHFVKLEDLLVRGIISNCTMGRIELVQYRIQPNLYFALKVLKKAYIAQNDLVQNALNEREILMSCRNPFIIRLYRTFKDDKHLFFLQEACLGGDVRYLLKQRNNFDDRMAKFISACVIEAFDYLHGNNIVYGNLETKNLVFDEKGYIKLVDFGMARRIEPKSNLINHEENHSNTEDLDPNMDYWILGCLIYEMLVGVPPFSEIDTFESDVRIKFPVHVTKPAKSIIRKMWKMKSNKENELQMLTADDFRQQKWFLNFNWAELQKRTMTAPYIPRIEDSTDLSCFETAMKDKEIPPDCFADWDKDF